MLFSPYNPNDAKLLSDMLTNHIDYAPDENPKRKKDKMADAFIEDYVDELNSGIHYVIKSDDGNAILGLLGAEKRNFKSGKECWYITSLFLLNNDNADKNALEMVHAFWASVHDTDELCVCVHPADTAIVDFWAKNGFAPNSDRTVFSNAEGDTLIAYWKER